MYFILLFWLHWVLVTVCRTLRWVTRPPLPQGMWDPRDRTHVPRIERWILNHWATEEVPQRLYLMCISYKQYTVGSVAIQFRGNCISLVLRTLTKINFQFKNATKLAFFSYWGSLSGELPKSFISIKKWCKIGSTSDQNNNLSYSSVSSLNWK